MHTSEPDLSQHRPVVQRRRSLQAPWPFGCEVSSCPRKPALVVRQNPALRSWEEPHLRCQRRKRRGRRSRGAPITRYGRSEIFGVEPQLLRGHPKNRPADVSFARRLNDDLVVGRWLGGRLARKRVVPLRELKRQSRG